MAGAGPPQECGNMQLSVVNRHGRGRCFRLAIMVM